MMHTPVKLFNRVQERQSGIYKNLPLTSWELTSLIISSIFIFYITPVVSKHVLTGFWVLLTQGIMVIVNIIFWILWALYMDDKPRFFFRGPINKELLKGTYVGIKERPVEW